VRWSVFIIIVLFTCALDASLGAVFEIGGIRGQLLPAVVVFMCLAAPKRIAVRAAMLAGLAADLFAPMVLADGTLLVVPGPRVLAFALGALAVVPLRGLLYRQNPLSSSAATFLFSLLVGIVWVFLWIIRSVILSSSAPWWPATGASEVFLRVFAAVGDAALALPVCWLLEKSRPLWGFRVTMRVSPGAARQGL
jgi:hypothetical protein